MAGKTVQRRRGTTAEHATFTGAVGELTVDTTKKTAVVHDGSTAGGNPLARAGANTDITSLGQNTSTAYTTGGTSTAYTLTPAPAITAYAAGQSFFVNFNAACGAAPTLAISGVATPPNLVKQNADGTYSNIALGDIAINHRSRVTLISATQALVEKINSQPSSFSADNNSVNIVIPDITWTAVAWSTERHDSNNEVSGGIFTAKKAGPHDFYAQWEGAAPIAGNLLSVALYLNGAPGVGTQFAVADKRLASNNAETVSVARRVNLAVGDTVRAAVYHNRGTNQELFGGQAYSFFCGGYTGA